MPHSLSGNPCRFDRDAGLVLGIVFGLVVVLFGVTAAIVGISTAQAKATRSQEETQIAFFQADAGLEAAKYELGEGVDVDGDGLGTRTFQSGGWDYSVTAEDLGNGRYLLTSVGDSGSETVTLSTVVREDWATVFPMAPLSVVGDVDNTKVEIKTSAIVILDGGNSTPAFATSDADYLAEMVAELAEAVKTGALDMENIIGAVSNLFYKATGLSVPDGTAYDPDDVIEFPISQSGDASVVEIQPLFDSLVDQINNEIIPSAVESDLAANDMVFGTEDAPQTVYFSGSHERTRGQTISGYGTLVINSLTMTDSKLDWNGDVFVIGGDETKAAVYLNGDSSMNVTGNLVVLGEGYEFAEFKVNRDASVSVVGSLFLGTSLTAESRELRFEVDRGGSLDVYGTFTAGGRSVKGTFRGGSSASITGMVQLASPDDAEGVASRFFMSFGGLFEAYMDSDAVGYAIEGWEEMGQEISLGEGTLGERVFAVESWMQTVQ